MIATLVTILVVVVGIWAVFQIQQGRPRAESRIVWMGYVAHVAASGAQYVITTYWYGGGDMLYYARAGGVLADLLSYDYARFAPEIFALFIHEPPHLPMDVIGAGSSTGSLVAVAALLLHLLGGSLLGVCVLLSTLAYLARIMMLRVFLEELPQELHPAVRIAVLLLPSVTFWGATLAKETMVLIGIGPLTWVARRLTSTTTLTQRLLLAPVALLAGGLLWLVKSYVLVSFIAAAAVWWFMSVLRRRGRMLTRVQLTFGAVISVAAVALVGVVLPDFSVDAIAERAAELQAVGGIVQGGSSYQLGSTEARSGLAQAAFVPLALMYSLFRPFLFEVRNPLMLLNAIETTWITVIVVQNFWKGGFAGLIATARESPVMAFSLVFVLLVGVGVGLATSNLGTLTRYRAPMMPFYAAFLVVWQHRTASAATRVRQLAAPKLAGRRRRRTELEAV